MIEDTPTLLLKRPTNESLRSPKYLLPDEVDKLLQAVKKMGRYGQ